METKIPPLIQGFNVCELAVCILWVVWEHWCDVIFREFTPDTTIELDCVLPTLNQWSAALSHSKNCSSLFRTNPFAGHVVEEGLVKNSFVHIGNRYVLDQETRDVRKIPMDGSWVPDHFAAAVAWVWDEGQSFRGVALPTFPLPLYMQKLWHFFILFFGQFTTDGIILNA